MKDCRKRQVERRKGEVIHRCIHKKADSYRQPVDADACAACPVRVMMEQAKGKHSLPVIEAGPSLPPCEFRFRPGGGPPACGVTGLPTDETICGRCAKETKMETARLVDKVINYATAVRKWIGAGRPERTDDEVKAIFDEHCNRCSMFDKQRGVCNSCGCPSNTNQPAIRNKLKMATEECPLGRFPAKVKVDA